MPPLTVGTTYRLKANPRAASGSISWASGGDTVVLDRATTDADGDLFATRVGPYGGAGYVLPSYLEETAIPVTETDLAAALRALEIDVDASKVIAVAKAIAQARA